MQHVIAPRAWTESDAQQSVVLVWGRKQNAVRAQAFARARGLPVWFLEDGFIRSCAADPHGRLSYSLLVDPVGVYYDSGSPSIVEQCLNLPDAEFAALATAEALASAASCRSQIVEHEITKYNYCRQAQVPAELAESERPLVMVIDQTRDDASVRCGGMSAQAFTNMLHAAIDENPGAQVVLRTHPDVVAGKRRGYLDADARRLGIPVIAERDNPMGWLKRSGKVYVATSQLGYEALLCGCEVVTFGQPFYAGWGLTDDRAPVPRRIRKRTLDELFFICHMHVQRYRNPVSGEAWSLQECIDHVRLQKREFARNAWHFHAVGITAWKRGYVRQYLRSPEGSVSFVPARKTVPNSKALSSADTGWSAAHACPSDTRSAWLTWSFRDQTGSANSSQASLQSGAHDTGWPTIRLEDGFLRSSGLGSDFVAPGSLVADSRGLYFDPQAPSDLEHLLNTADCSTADLQRASMLRQSIVSSRVSKYNLAGTDQPFWRAADRHRVLVIGQVDDDQSVRRGSLQVRSNRELLVAARRARPASMLVYRPHPDVISGNRQGEIDDALAAGLADVVDTNSHIVDCIESCNELHTMTSLAGFEALMRGRSVVTYGSPFYAGWGLTEDQESTPRRVRRRSLDDLVFMTLIAYARYMDIETGEFISAEDRVAALQRERLAVDTRRSRVPGAPLTKIANIVKGLRYAP